MPYSTQYHKEDTTDPYWVVDDAGAAVGKHPTPKLQRDHLRALYANVSDAKEGKRMGGIVDKGVVIGEREGKETLIPIDTDQRTGLIDRLLSAFKVGRRNSGTDEGRLQTIHDLAVENGAQCPMVLKQADGRLRWVLFSTNSFEDSDQEIVSQKSLEDDADRMDQTKEYGPLRWWHIGLPNTVTKEAGPGFDIGDCDFVAIHDHVRIDSGTFRNERIGEAIKEHADDFGASIGFFHPLDEPDREGVYHNIYSFERSLLPRGKASNSLTALAVIDKESDMATLKDKLDDFAARFGNDPETVKQFMTMAEQIEQKAKERGLRQKETPATDAVPAAPAAEPQKDEPAEDEVDYEAMAKGLQPFIEKMIEEKMTGAVKERTEKEASLTAQITALDSTLKETRKIVDVLNSDLPKGVKQFIASQSESTVTTDPKYAHMKEAQEKHPMADIFNWVAQPVGVPAVQTSPEK